LARIGGEAAGAGVARSKGRRASVPGVFGAFGLAAATPPEQPLGDQEIDNDGHVDHQRQHLQHETLLVSS
jgi:hypothetical protein